MIHVFEYNAATIKLSPILYSDLYLCYTCEMNVKVKEESKGELEGGTQHCSYLIQCLLRFKANRM